MLRDQRIFFYHNPKAGGTFLKSMLDERFPESSRSPIIENDRDAHLQNAGDYSRFRGYSLYAGHYGRNIYDAVSNGHQAITNFRYPVDRIISLYEYFRYSVRVSEATLDEPRYFAVRTAKSRSFEEFVRHDDARIRLYIRDWHSRQLSATPFRNGLPQFDRAEELVRSMPWFYICEYPGLSLAWASESLGWRNLCERRINIRSEDAPSGRQSVSADLRRFLIDTNRYDLALYRLAVDRLLCAMG